jgi:hypothetical protein
MTRPDPLDYAGKSRSAESLDASLEASRVAKRERAEKRWSTFRKIRMILRVVYLVLCLAALAFAWKYIQGYIQLLDNAGN